MLESFTKLSGGAQQLQQLKLKALILDLIHHVDVADQLIANQTQDLSGTPFPLTPRLVLAKADPNRAELQKPRDNPDGPGSLRLHLRIPGQRPQTGAHAIDRQMLPDPHPGNEHGLRGEPLRTRRNRKSTHYLLKPRPKVSKPWGRPSAARSSSSTATRASTSNPWGASSSGSSSAAPGAASTSSTVSSRSSSPPFRSRYRSSSGR